MKLKNRKPTAEQMRSIGVYNAHGLWKLLVDRTGVKTVYVTFTSHQAGSMSNFGWHLHGSLKKPRDPWDTRSNLSTPTRAEYNPNSEVGHNGLRAAETAGVFEVGYNVWHWTKFNDAWWLTEHLDLALEFFWKEYKNANAN